MKSLNSFFAILLIATAIARPASGAKTELIDPLPKKYSTPEIAGIEKWFNSKPLKISSLKDKVVLIDFWTYSCINCLRTLPHINELHEKYADKGLVIIGIHAPEFDFEKNQKNVEMAIKRFVIKYPVGLDNGLKTWHNFKNHYWPAHYLIDKKGRIVYAHFGEGKYDVMENNVVALLVIDLNN
jgi:thiol-disulfide isomerase/thioredoxin